MSKTTLVPELITLSDGTQTWVLVKKCPPSRRKASSSIQQKVRMQKFGTWTRYTARENIKDAKEE